MLRRNVPFGQRLIDVGVVDDRRDLRRRWHWRGGGRRRREIVTDRGAVGSLKHANHA
jgi:hypothetical protein